MIKKKTKTTSFSGADWVQPFLGSLSQVPPHPFVSPLHCYCNFGLTLKGVFSSPTKVLDA